MALHLLYVNGLPNSGFLSWPQILPAFPVYLRLAWRQVLACKDGPKPSLPEEACSLVGRQSCQPTVQLLVPKKWKKWKGKWSPLGGVSRRGEAGRGGLKEGLMGGGQRGADELRT